MNNHTPQCCICHKYHGELQTVTRWLGPQREYCELDWIRLGQYRALQELGPVHIEASEGCQ